MTREQKALRFGAVLLVGALLLRLLSGQSDSSLPGATSQTLSQLILFFQTGRWVQSDVLTLSQPEAPTVETAAPAAAPLPLCFSPEEASVVELRNTSGYDMDLAGLLCAPLNWDLTENSPSVLILHTHGTESYAGTENYRSRDTEKNMIAIGAHLAQLLEAGGIGVIHDKTMHDADSYNGSYALARESIAQHLKDYPSIRLVLDLHRDSAEDGQGNQIRYTVPTGQGEAAKLMLVMGTDAGGLTHPNWQENPSLAVKLQVVLERLCPQSCRPMYVRTSRFNQDLCPGALLVEVGAAGNTQQEALRAAELLAQGLLALKWGAAG